MADPRYEPTVPAMITPLKLRWPCAAGKAAGGITTSLGTGKIELSIAIKITMPKYPQCCDPTDPDFQKVMHHRN